MTEKKNYTVELHCTNCNHFWKSVREKGVPILLVATECPNCNCLMTERSWERPIIFPTPMPWRERDFIPRPTRPKYPKPWRFTIT